jgi:hypothetical protein
MHGSQLARPECWRPYASCCQMDDIPKCLPGPRENPSPPSCRAHNLSMCQGPSMRFWKQIVILPAGPCTRFVCWLPARAEPSGQEGCRWSRIVRFSTTSGRSTRCSWPERPTTASPIPAPTSMPGCNAALRRRGDMVQYARRILSRCGRAARREECDNALAARRRVGRAFPGRQIVSDQVYVEDGPLYTSAGVTAGIDQALKLIEADHGRDLALTRLSEANRHRPHDYRERFRG